VYTKYYSEISSYLDKISTVDWERKFASGGVGGGNRMQIVSPRILDKKVTSRGGPKSRLHAQNRILFGFRGQKGCFRAFL